MRIITKVLFVAFIIIFSCFFSFGIKRPALTVQVNNLFVDLTEMDMGSYITYYLWVKKNYGDYAAKKVLPSNEFIVPTWFWNHVILGDINLVFGVDDYSGGMYLGKIDRRDAKVKAFEKQIKSKVEYLVISGLSFEQANAFTAWRTLIADWKGLYTYRLPSVHEWTSIANFLNSLEAKQHEQPDSINKNPLFNFYGTHKNEKGETLLFPPQVSLYQNGKTGIYDIWGNVSEMTSTEGIAKGGNYLLYANQCHIDSVQHYTKPEKWLGFRTVSEPIAQSKINRDSLIREHIRFFFDDRHDFFVDSRDGNFYRTVKIGNQTWMAQNLAYQPTEGKWWSLERKIDYTKTLGALYNPESAANACPKGWRLPSKEDFEELVNQFGGIDKACSELLVNGKSGFAAFPVTFKSGINFIPTEYFMHFWAKDETAKKQVVTLCMDKDDKTIKFNPHSKDSDGISIRCIKE